MACDAPPNINVRMVNVGNTANVQVCGKHVNKLHRYCPMKQLQECMYIAACTCSVFSHAVHGAMVSIEPVHKQVCCRSGRAYILHAVLVYPLKGHQKDMRHATSNV